MKGVELDIDLGELPAEPRELYALATIANVACGGHTGDAASMARAVSYCLARGTALAAHPSYPDRERFGRVSMTMAPAELAASVEAQVAALQAIATRLGLPARAVKAHGALYHDAHADPVIARALLDGARAGLGPGELVVIGLAGGALEEACTAEGVVFAREGFADRARDKDGKLVPRSTPGALLTDPQLCARQAIALASTGKIEAICVHGDTPNALAIAQAVRGALEGAGLLASR